MKNLNCSSRKETYSCNKCKDLNFIIKDDVAYECECVSLKKSYELLKSSGISEEFRNKNFENFNCLKDTQIINAYKRAIEYSDSFDFEKANSIMFLGQVGCGKTHLSLAIANRLMKNNVGVLYMPYRESIIKIKQNVMDSVYYEKVMSRYKNAKVLLIDDLFKGSLSQSDINIMFEIINFRYFNNLAVIVSSEKNVSELFDIDEAIGSRLYEMAKDNIISIKGRKLNYRIYS